jgi:hypothetical protein
MDSLTLRALIRTKLADGRLPTEPMPRVWGGPGNGERCDACEKIITSKELIMEGLPAGGARSLIQLHVECFYIWDTERRMLPPA